MTQAHPCLLSVGKTSSRYRHFPFLEDQTKIGRSADATYTILSPMISRCHAIIHKTDDNTWTITDNKSLNGIAVNGKTLTPLEAYTLQEGDIVQLGVPTSPDVPAEFVYRFYTALKVRREQRVKHKRSHSDDDSPVKRFKDAEKPEDQNGNLQRAHTKPSLDEASGKDAEQQEKLKAAYEEQLRALAQQLKEKEEEKVKIQEQLHKEREQREVIEERQKEQEEKVNQLDAKQRQLMKEKAAAEETMRLQLAEELREREEQLRIQMQQQLASLAAEKSQVEQKLQAEMERAVQEKDRELQNRLRGEKERLQKIIETKELEQKALESQLVQTRVENEKARADNLTTREAILSEFADTMETELQCSICSELFIKATSLNCSHSFCALCIRQWLAVKKECPNCRSPVTSQMKSIVLDNYIDRMVDQLSAELKQRRAIVVAERKEAEDKLDTAEQEAKAGPSSARGRRGRPRGGARGRHTIQEILAENPQRHTNVPRGGINNFVTRAATRASTSRTTAVSSTTATITTAGAAAATVTAAAEDPAVPLVGATVTVGPTDVVATVSHDSVDLMNDTAGAAGPIVVSDNEGSDNEGSEVVLSSDEQDSENWDDNDDIHAYEFGRYRRRYHDLDTDDDEENDDEDDDDESGGSHSGEHIRGDGGYYGGYGSCFICGARGHWAPGCPNR